MSETNPSLPIWRRIALPASIVLNLFFIALVGGHVWRVAAERPMAGPPWSRALARAEAALPPKDAVAFGAVIRREAPRYAPARRQLIEARQQLERLISAEQFDPAAVRQALANWHSAWNDFFDGLSDSLVDALAQVSPEGRRKLIDQRRAANPGLR